MQAVPRTSAIVYVYTPLSLSLSSFSLNVIYYVIPQNPPYYQTLYIPKYLNSQILYFKYRRVCGEEHFLRCIQWPIFGLLSHITSVHIHIKYKYIYFIYTYTKVVPQWSPFYVLDCFGRHVRPKSKKCEKKQTLHLHQTVNSS